jgi:hypothetical protein
MATIRKIYEFSMKYHYSEIAGTGELWGRPGPIDEWCWLHRLNSGMEKQAKPFFPG